MSGRERAPARSKRGYGAGKGELGGEVVVDLV